MCIIENSGVPIRFASGRAFQSSAIAPAASLASLSPVAALRSSMPSRRDTPCFKHHCF
ncbi:MAG: hypothetical protein MR739_05930 [Spirochaetia bacterium]|nr:hypothetical protein [Spirochaetia bacterium]